MFVALYFTCNLISKEYLRHHVFQLSYHVQGFFPHLRHLSIHSNVKDNMFLKSGIKLSQKLKNPDFKGKNW